MSFVLNLNLKRYLLWNLKHFGFSDKEQAIPPLTPSGLLEFAAFPALWSDLPKKIHKDMVLKRQARFGVEG